MKPPWRNRRDLCSLQCLTHVITGQDSKKPADRSIRVGATPIGFIGPHKSPEREKKSTTLRSFYSVDSHTNTCNQVRKFQGLWTTKNITDFGSVFVGSSCSHCFHQSTRGRQKKDQLYRVADNEFRGQSLPNTGWFTTTFVDSPSGWPQTCSYDSAMHLHVTSECVGVL